jgi:hypothetical protein
VALTMASGTLAGPDRDIGAEAGYAFFRARMMAMVMGGSVACERQERSCRLILTLPR